MREYVFRTSSGNLLAGLCLQAYPHFGVYVWRSRQLYMVVRCASELCDDTHGHFHNDQLSLELWMEGKPLIVDPGSAI